MKQQEEFEGKRRTFRPEPEVIPADAPMREEEVFDEDGDIPDNDEVILYTGCPDREEQDEDPEGWNEGEDDQRGER